MATYEPQLGEMERWIGDLNACALSMGLPAVITAVVAAPETIDWDDGTTTTNEGVPAFTFTEAAPLVVNTHMLAVIRGPFPNAAQVAWLDRIAKLLEGAGA